MVFVTYSIHILIDDFQVLAIENFDLSMVGIDVNVVEEDDLGKVFFNGIKDFDTDFRVIYHVNSYIIFRFNSQNNFDKVLVVVKILVI